MSRGKHLWLEASLLYGSPILAAAISVALFAAASKKWVSAEWYVMLLFPLNAILGIVGAAASGFIGRDRPAARLRGAIDCGAFGLVTHLMALAALAYGSSLLGLAR